MLVASVCLFFFVWLVICLFVCLLVSFFVCWICLFVWFVCLLFVDATVFVVPAAADYSVHAAAAAIAVSG